MDGEINGKLYFLMDDLGVKPTILGNIQMEEVSVAPASNVHGEWSKVSNSTATEITLGEFAAPCVITVQNSTYLKCASQLKSRWGLGKFNSFGTSVHHVCHMFVTF